MSNTKYTKAQRLEFKERLLKIEDSIPDKYSEIIFEETGKSKDIIRNVRHGRTIDFYVLEKLESISTKKEAVK